MLLEWLEGLYDNIPGTRESPHLLELEWLRAARGGDLCDWLFQSSRCCYRRMSLRNFAQALHPDVAR